MLMRLLLIFFTLLSPAATLLAQDEGGLKKNPFTVPCARYWTGHMIYNTEPYLGIKIIRKRKKHTEINPQTQVKSIFKIEWTGDCSYILTFKKATGPTRFKKGWFAEVEITQAYDEYYEFKSDLHGIVGYGTVQKDLSPKEKKMKIKMAEDSVKQARKDSIRIARGDTLDKKSAKSDSTLAKGNNKKGEGPAAAKADDKKGKKGDSEKPEEGTADKKKEKTKKEKAPKEKKEKAEKPPKEKKEKAPKEKKEKPPKDDEEDDD